MLIPLFYHGFQLESLTGSKEEHLVANDSTRHVSKIYLRKGNMAIYWPNDLITLLEGAVSYKLHFCHFLLHIWPWLYFVVKALFPWRQDMHFGDNL